jgi:hypothetical protein
MAQPTRSPEFLVKAIDIADEFSADGAMADVLFSIIFMCVCCGAAVVI